MTMKMEIPYTFILLLVASTIAEVNRPRGVAISKASMYQPGSDFTCFDGSATIQFEYVNDDYCDCSDGSDEPGTSACPNGSYHCTNAGHRPSNILSSRVNDGICDCCDGTDEYGSGANCPNTCKELGRKAREDEEIHRKLLEEGYNIYQDYVKKGQESLKEKQARRETLLKEKSDLETVRGDLETIKNEAEAPEKEAKDRHQKAYDEEKERKKQELDSFRASDAFSDLDTNQDNLITLEEVKAHPEFDIDSNGEVSNEEALEYLEENEAIDFNVFTDKVWPNIREIYKAKVEAVDESGEPVETDESTTVRPPIDLKEGAAPPAGADDISPPSEEPTGTPPLREEDLHSDEHDYPDDYYDDEEDEMGDEDDYEGADHKSAGDAVDDEIPPYDEETQDLIDAANKARDEFNEVDQKYKDIDSELRSLDEELGLEYGQNNEFFILKGQCFEYTESQYTYKLCPFDKTSQRGKHGGAETSLGRWGRWDGPENNRYSVMLYDKGQNCWNGPDRSVRVKLQCGTSNQVFGASEPNRCEYEYKFSTPAACSSVPPPPIKDPNHDEL